MEISAAPGIDEIRLHLATPATGLSRFLDEDATQPYWAFAWGGGLALARHVLDHPQSVRGRRVMDLGSGSGLVAIAAMKAGAASAVAVDIDPRAAVAARLNAELNGVAVETVTTELLDGSAPEGVDLILIGDLFYSADLVERAIGFVRRCQAAGLEILIGDPRRATLPTHDLVEVRRLDAFDFGGGEAMGSIFRPNDYSPRNQTAWKS